MRAFGTGIVTVILFGFYFSCGTADQKIATKELGADVIAPELSLDEATAALNKSAKQTPDSPEGRAFLGLVGNALFQMQDSQGSCGCPGAGAPGKEQFEPEALFLDGAVDADEGASRVAGMCSLVGQSANLPVEGDGGCWLRANALCMAGMSEGLSMGKVWIIGDVIDSSGNFWNFHVANTYDGKVYDAGFELNGVTLDDWQARFTGKAGSTKLVLTNCASHFAGTKVFENRKFSEQYVSTICKAAQDFGGESLLAEMDSWIQEVAQRRDNGIVNLGARCAGVVSRDENKLSYSTAVKGPGPKFRDSLGMSAQCKEAVYSTVRMRLGAAAGDQETQEDGFVFDSFKEVGIPGVLSAMVFRFERPMESGTAKQMTAIVDRSCTVRALL